MDKLEKYKDEAFEMLQSCHSDEDAEWARVPVNYVKRWAKVFENSIVNLDALAEIARQAKQERGTYGIRYDLFLMSRVRVYQELFEEFLRRKFLEQDITSHENYDEKLVKE